MKIQAIAKGIKQVVKPKQLLLPFQKKKPKQIQLTFKFPKETKSSKKLDKTA